MKIAKDSVVRFHYSVSEPGQESLESSRDREPLAILIGHGNIIPGLEAVLHYLLFFYIFVLDVAASEA